MLILGLEGLAGLESGKCRNTMNIHICLLPLFTLLKQNTGLTTARMLPVTGGR
jgi:hypothetical protein